MGPGTINDSGTELISLKTFKITVTEPLYDLVWNVTQYFNTCFNLKGLRRWNGVCLNDIMTAYLLSNVTWIT